MFVFRLRLPVLMLGAAVAAAGCGGRGSLPQNGFTAFQQMRTASGTSGDLLYISRIKKEGKFGYSSSLSVLTFPQGKAVANISLPNFITGMCADALGNVWVVDGHPPRDFNAFKYLRGGTEPIAKIHIPDAQGFTSGCAIDPTTGNLAVLAGTNSAAHIDVWAGPTEGKPASYPINFTPIACAYDDGGNLFVDGDVGGTSVIFLLAELSKGSRAVATVKTSFGSFPGGVVWDGKYIAVASGTTIYRITVSGSVAHIVGQVDLKKMHVTTPLAVAAGTAVASRGYGNRVSLWRYPAGGAPTKTVERVEFPPAALTISVPGSTR